MLLPCKNQAKHQSFALRFKCPDQSGAPGRKGQFRLEPEKTFSANFWEVKQPGFRKLPSKGYLEGRRISAGAEEVALSLSSQPGNYYWPPARNTPHRNTRPALWKLSPKCPCSSAAFQRRMSFESCQPQPSAGDVRLDIRVPESRRAAWSQTPKAFRDGLCPNRASRPFGMAAGP